MNELPRTRRAGHIIATMTAMFTPEIKDLDLCFYCDGTYTEHEKDCPQHKAPTSAEENQP